MDISEKTKIPLFVVIGAIPILAAFTFWMSTIYIAGETANAVNLKQDEKIDNLNGILLDIRDRVIRIEERVKKRGGDNERN